jgi:hypothetical protein
MTTEPSSLSSSFTVPAFVLWNFNLVWFGSTLGALGFFVLGSFFSAQYSGIIGSMASANGDGLVISVPFPLLIVPAASFID